MVSPRWPRHVTTFGLGALAGGLLVFGLAGGNSVEPIAAPAERRAFPPVSPLRSSEARPPRPSPGAEPPAPPPQSLAGILLAGTDFEQTATLYELAGNASVAALQQLIDEAGSLPGGVDRRAALSILYARYADLDPDGAVDYLLASGSIYDEVAVRSVFHAWARHDLQAAVARAATLEARLRAQAGSVILLSRHDLLPARQEEIVEELDIQHVLQQVVARQTMDDVGGNPQMDWDAAAAEARGPLRQQRLAGIARVWARHDPMAAMNAVLALDETPLQTGLLQQVMWSWSEQNPRDAVNWAISQPPGAQRGQLIEVALSSLATTDPRTAFDLAQSLPPAERDEAMNGVFGAWAQADAAAAAAALATVTEQQTRRQAIHQIAHHFIVQDPDAAVRWLGTLNDEEADNAAMFLGMLAYQDPTSTAELLPRLPERMQASAAQSVVQAWAQRDPEAAAAWLERAPQALQSAAAHSALAQQWAQYDRDAALRYVDRIASRRQREQALIGVMQAQSGDPAFAEALYDELELEESRRMAAQWLYSVLREAEPVRAEEYAWAAVERSR